MAGISKTRAALYAQILAIITDGGELTAQELRAVLDDFVASALNLEDDFQYGAHSAQRDYKAGDIITKDSRILTCLNDITAKTFLAADWEDSDFQKTVKDLDITGLSTMDIGTVQNNRRIDPSSSNGTETISSIENGIGGYIYRFIPENGLTLTFTHTGIATATGGQIVSTTGANLVLVGRSGRSSDWAEFYYDETNDIWLLYNHAIYP